MKKNVLAILAIATLSITACKKADTVETKDQVEATATPENSVKYNVAAGEAINWEGGKVSGDKHLGTLALKSGEISVDAGKVIGGTFEIDMNSINVTDITDAEMKAGLEGHLKGTEAGEEDHFFNVTKFPTAKFEITSVKEENGKQVVEGNLTLKDITKSIKFPATITVSDAEVSIVSDEFSVDRTQFGVNFNSGTLVKDLAADKIINDDIKLKVNVKATK